MGLFDKIKNKLFFNEKNIEKYDMGLKKTRKEFISKLNTLSNKYKNINENYFEELEEILIMADMGVETVVELVNKLKKRVSHENITDANDLKEILVDELFIIYVNEGIVDTKININPNGPTVILFVGVNGVGKTTSIGKLAYKYKHENKKVLLIAGDTFRAGAIEQLDEWAKRNDVPIILPTCSDPSSVIFEGLTLAKNENYDIVLIDTAGRLQNKVNLMNELSKINKVINKVVPGGPHETLLVIDAITGQNGISQAKSFMEVTNVTGVILTKLDGTAKGGIILAIKAQTGLIVKYVGLGEKIDDLEVFDIEKYIYGLFKELI